ncbi:hypothetical protein, partial [Bacillus pumilus]|uniref:hypothetical protein n=1 Tax=Bacillus pumilus TaxID=1408 RepID=UPI001C930F01
MFMMEDLFNEVWIWGGRSFVFEDVWVVRIGLILWIRGGGGRLGFMDGLWYGNVLLGLNEMNVWLYVWLIEAVKKSLIVRGRFLRKRVLNE